MEDVKQVEQISKLLKNSKNLDILDSMFSGINKEDWMLIKAELKKNTYTDDQYRAIANLLFRLNNIKSIKLSNIKYNSLPKLLYNNYTKMTNKSYNSFNISISPIIQQIMASNNGKNLKLNIILRFIDEFLYLTPIKNSQIIISNGLKENIDRNNNTIKDRISIIQSTKNRRNSTMYN